MEGNGIIHELRGNDARSFAIGVEIFLIGCKVVFLQGTTWGRREDVIAIFLRHSSGLVEQCYGNRGGKLGVEVDTQYVDRRRDATRIASVQEKSDRKGRQASMCRHRCDAGGISVVLNDDDYRDEQRNMRRPHEILGTLVSSTGETTGSCMSPCAKSDRGPSFLT